MLRYIDADALYDNISDLFVEYLAVTSNNEARNIVKSLYKVILDDSVDNAPTVSPDEVRGVGEWEDAKQHGLCRCSVCKDCYIEKDYITQAKWRYCPNCGARMSRAEAEKAMEVSDDA